MVLCVVKHSDYYRNGEPVNFTAGDEYVLIRIHLLGLPSYDNDGNPYFKLDGENFAAVPSAQYGGWLEKQLKEAQKDKKQQDIIRILEARISELEKALEAEAEKEKELYALREFVFSLKQDENITTEEEITIPSVRAVIVGGTERWQKAIAQHLPETFSFILPEAVNYDVSILKNNEFVFIYTSYINHSIYYKTVNNLPDHVKLGFINQQNINLALKQIASQIKEVK